VPGVFVARELGECLPVCRKVRHGAAGFLVSGCGVERRWVMARRRPTMKKAVQGARIGKSEE
jgi:hypothetical protein